jgi:hypothetical protein
MITLRIFVGRAELYRRDTTIEQLGRSLDALAVSMRALEARGRVVAVAECGNLCQVLGRTGGPTGHFDGMA